jgi:hypothetical protein
VKELVETELLEVLKHLYQIITSPVTSTVSQIPPPNTTTKTENSSKSKISKSHIKTLSVYRRFP